MNLHCRTQLTIVILEWCVQLISPRPLRKVCTRVSIDTCNAEMTLKRNWAGACDVMCLSPRHPAGETACMSKRVKPVHRHCQHQLAALQHQQEPAALGDSLAHAQLAASWQGDGVAASQAFLAEVSVAIASGQLGLTAGPAAQFW
jgi:hypothetical protein